MPPPPTARPPSRRGRAALAVGLGTLALPIALFVALPPSPRLGRACRWAEGRRAAVLVDACRGIGARLAAGGGSPRPADAIAVLGANGVFRIRRGAELYREGWAERVVLFNSDLERLVSLDVPPAVVETVDGPATTRDELEWLVGRGRSAAWSRVLVVTDPPHLARVRRLADRLTREDTVEIVSVAADTGWWQPDAWWRSDHASTFVLGEIRSLLWSLVPARLSRRP